MIALCNHYAGKGNSTHCISDANWIRSTLHYKSERALPFSTFLDSMQKMFTIFQEEGEPLTEQAKVDELLTKVQHPSLTVAITQLHYQLNTKGVTFTVAANHLNFLAISQTPDYQMAWHINSTNSSNQNVQSGGCEGGHGGGHGGGCNSGHGGCNGHGGRCGRGNNNSDKVTPNTSGFYPMVEWNKLSFEEWDKIQKEHDKKANLVEPSISLATSPLNMSLPSSVLCNKHNQHLPQKKQSLLPTLSGGKLFWWQSERQEVSYHRMTGSGPS